MVSMDKSLLCCFLWIYAVCGSDDVQILEPECLANGKACECGRNLTLSCKLRINTFAIAWMNENDITPIAQCVRNNCAINSGYIHEYTISYDKTEYIFNLTIIKLTMKDNGRKMVCSDGTSTDTKFIRVRDIEPLLFENTTTGTIHAISGCVSDGTKVSFKWIKIDANNKREKEITPKIQNATVTICSNDSDCGNDQQIQYSEVITAKASNNGTYFLKIVADYGNEQKESYHTVGRYELEDRGLNGVDILEPECLANGRACECGRDLTISCKFRNNTFATAWMDQNDTTQIAHCVGTNCAINPGYIDRYNISYDNTKYIFNLTIIKLTMKDNGRKMVCSDGTSTDTTFIRVRDYEPHLLENTTTGTIQAISGCISKATKVSIKWIKICARSKDEQEFIPKIQNASITSCSNGSDCGNDQQFQYSEVISAKANDNGNYFLKIVADYGDEQKESYNTVGRYILKDRGTNINILELECLANGKTCACGRDLTLSCMFINKTFAIAWMNPNDISQIAKCERNYCTVNPGYIDQYKISYDEKNHFFNLTIIKLTMKDNQRTLICSDGTDMDSQNIRVRDYEPFLLENTTTGTIQAISGCVSNGTKVSFKWIKICARSNSEEIITPKIQNASTTRCSYDSDCGNDQQIQYSEVLSAKASDNGNYYLKIVANYGNEKIESYRTDGRYILEEEEKSNSLIVVPVVLGCLATFLLACGIVRYNKKLNNCTWKNEKGKSEGKRILQTKMWCNGTEDLATSDPDSNLGLPKYDEEVVSSDVNELTVNDYSPRQVVPESEEENLLSRENDKENDFFSVNDSTLNAHCPIV
ncbi:uncharacterized protein LOC132754330 isoform X2 [Ruditapes philippinarum]|uniref:uncharacterized protein LOC132754330 isoform X2 n=1 Tax=Ruditapes philippinarum TaxID=129788 RepID=UPI00295B7258|nr:uncharacterized protein LOC132754330 isoform X2 [Ruditapes philippinarum]